MNVAEVREPARSPLPLLNLGRRTTMSLKHRSVVKRASSLTLAVTLLALTAVVVTPALAQQTGTDCADHIKDSSGNDLYLVLDATCDPEGNPVYDYYRSPWATNHVACYTNGENSALTTCNDCPADNPDCSPPSPDSASLKGSGSFFHKVWEFVDWATA
jgi:hypothetical protein